MTKTKTKKLAWIALIVLVVALVVAAIFYFQNQNKVSDDVNTPDTTQTSTETETNEQQQETSDDEAPEVTTAYKIENLNKKDGDLFAIPDEVTFNINPVVDKTKVTLTYSKGVVLYFEEKAGTSGNYTIYPEGRLSEGSKGTLKIEGFKDGKVVVTEEVGVIF